MLLFELTWIQVVMIVCRIASILCTTSRLFEINISYKFSYIPVIPEITYFIIIILLDKLSLSLFILQIWSNYLFIFSFNKACSFKDLPWLQHSNYRLECRATEHARACGSVLASSISRLALTKKKVILTFLSSLRVVYS